MNVPGSKWMRMAPSRNTSLGFLVGLRAALLSWAWACDPSHGGLWPARRSLALLALALALDGPIARRCGARVTRLSIVLDNLCNLLAHLANYSAHLASSWAIRCLMLLEICAHAAITATGGGWEAALCDDGGGSWTRALVRSFFADNQRNALSMVACACHVVFPAVLSWAHAQHSLAAHVALAAAAAGTALYAVVTMLMLPLLLESSRPFGPAWHATCAPVDCAVFFFGAAAACLGGLGTPAALLALFVFALLPLLPRAYFLPATFVCYEGVGALLAPFRCAPADSAPDRLMLYLEASLFGGKQPCHELRAALALPRALGELCYASYILYVPVLILTVLFAYATQRADTFERLVAQLSWNFVLVWTLNLATNVQGPMVLAGAGLLPKPDPAEMGYWLPHLTRQVNGNLACTGTAFPSGHCAIAVCCLCMLSRCGIGARALGAVGAFVSLLVFSTVWTGMHYVLDAVAGVALALVVHRLTAVSAPPVPATKGE